MGIVYRPTCPELGEVHPNCRTPSHATVLALGLQVLRFIWATLRRADSRRTVKESSALGSISRFTQLLRISYCDVISGSAK